MILLFLLFAFFRLLSTTQISEFVCVAISSRDICVVIVVLLLSISPWNFFLIRQERKHDENAERAAQDAARAQARRKQLYAKSAPSALDRFKKK